MLAIVALAFKDLRLLLRDRLGAFFTFGFPLIMAIFFGVIFSGNTGGGVSALKIAVVDEDRTPGSERFIADLDASEEFQVLRLDDLAEARERVRKGSGAVAFVRIHPGFGEAAERMFWGDPMRLTVGVDPSRKAEAGIIEGLLQAKAYERMQDLFTDPARGRKMAQDALAMAATDPMIPPAVRGVLVPFLGQLERFMADLPEALADEENEGGDAGVGFQPLVLEKETIATEADNAYAITFPQGIIWGLMGTAAGFGISLVTERTRGTLMRLRMSPVPPLAILLGKGLACLITTLTVAAVLLVIAATIFGVRPTSVPLLAAGVLSAGIGFVGIMMLLSVVGKTEAAAGGIGWTVLLMLGMVGGAMVPQIAMPAWMQRISGLTPVGWAVRAIEGPLWRGYSTQDMLAPCGLLLGIGVVGFVVGARLFSFEDRG